MQAQVRLVERNEAKTVGDHVNIPYTKFVLSNGLTLIVNEDHSDPIVHVDITYHVGSAREEIGQSGFAHFFEHMMFQGSKHVADEEHFKIITAAGGTMNGSTNRDRTNYFETVPKNYLETALWLEADRMGFLLDAVTQQKFEIQRATVKNEKGQRYENRPYGMVGEITGKNLYPFGHPYSWPTIGYVEDLNRVNVEDLKKFFLRWYGPNNAVLTVGGDVDAAEVVQLVEKYFGSIPAGPAVQKEEPRKFSLSKDRYVSMEDNIRFPMLKVTYPSTPSFDEDEAPLDILSEILGQGKSSILYQNFIKPKKAIQAYASNPTSELAGEFSITVLAYPDTKLSEIDSMIRESINEIETRGITDDDLAKAKAKRVAEAVYSLESVSGKVSQLAAYETFLGKPGYIGEDIDRYQRVTKADIIRVFNKYIKGKHALYLSVYPKGKKDLIAAADNYTAGGDTASVVHRERYDTLKYRPVVDDFNRAKHPKPGPSPVVNMPPYEKQTTMNGLNYIVVHNDELPDVYMQINIKGGQAYQLPGKEGIAYLLARMLQESNGMYSSEQLNDTLDKLGSKINIYSDEEDIVVTVQSLSKNLPRTIGVLQSMLMAPKFVPEELDRVKKQQLELIANQNVQADAMANAAFDELLYGNNTALGTPIYGTKSSVESITERDLRVYHNGIFTPKGMNVVVSGQADPELIKNMMLSLTAGAPPRPVIPSRPVEPVKVEKTKVYLVNKEKAPQSEIRVGYVAMPYDATGEFYKANIMNYVLGGAFNSRINLNLREDKGWTYGARSFFSGSHFPGVFCVSTGVKADATDSAVYEIMKELKEYRDKGITKDELAFTKKAILERDALRYETNSQKAGFVGNILEYGLDSNFRAQQVGILKKLKTKDIKALAQKHLPVDQMVIVVVGDAEAARPGLEKMGYEVVDFKPFDQAMKH